MAFLPVDNNNLVMKTALSNVTADGKPSFRTALFGFNKGAVNDYIGKLYSELSVEESLMDAKLAQADTDKASLQNKISELEDQLSSLQVKVSYELSFIKEFHDREEGYKSSISQLGNVISNLADKLKLAGDMNKSLNLKLAQAEADKTTAVSNLEKMQTSVSELGEKHLEFSDEVKQLEQDKKDLEEQVDEQKKQAEDKEKEILEIKEKLRKSEADTKALSEQMEIAKTRLTQLVDAYKKSKEQITSLKMEVSEEKKKNETSQNNAAVNEEILAQLETEKKKNLDNTQALEAVTVKNNELKKELNTRVGQLKQLAGTYNNAVAELKNRAETINKLQTKLTESAAKQSQIIQQYNLLNSKYVTGQIELSEKNSAILSLKNQMNSLAEKMGDSSFL